MRSLTCGFRSGVLLFQPFRSDFASSAISAVNLSSGLSGFASSRLRIECRDARYPLHATSASTSDLNSPQALAFVLFVPLW